MEVKFAEKKYFDKYFRFDPHASKIGADKIRNKIQRKEVILALVDEKIVGFLRFTYLFSEKPFIEFTYTDQESRSQGVGTKLVEFLEDYLKQNNYQYLYVSLVDSQYAPKSWYEKMGFEEIGDLANLELPESENKRIFFYKKI